MDTQEAEAWLDRHRPAQSPFKGSYTLHDQGRKLQTDHADVLYDKTERVMIAKQKTRALCHYNGRYFSVTEISYDLNDRDWEGLAYGATGAIGGAAGVAGGLALFQTIPFFGKTASVAIGFIGTGMTIIGGMGLLIGTLLTFIIMGNIKENAGAEPELSAEYIGDSREGAFLQACDDGNWSLIELIEGHEYERHKGSSAIVRFLSSKQGVYIQEGEGAAIEHTNNRRKFEQVLLRNELFDTYQDRFGELPEAFDPDTGEVIEDNKPLP